MENEAFIELAEHVKEMTRYANEHAITIAVMGCRVNGPGETDDADLGLWCGPNFVNLKRGSVELGAYPYDAILPRLKEELDQLIATAAGQQATEPPRYAGLRRDASWLYSGSWFVTLLCPTSHCALESRMTRLPLSATGILREPRHRLRRLAHGAAVASQQQHGARSVGHLQRIATAAKPPSARRTAALRTAVSTKLGLPISDEPIHVYLFPTAEKFEAFFRARHPDAASSPGVLRRNRHAARASTPTGATAWPRTSGTRSYTAICTRSCPICPCGWTRDWPNTLKCLVACRA